MSKLFEGVKEFSRKGYVNNQNLYRSLSNQQTPDTLFITCSDSRIVPNLITNTRPGELFVIRNIANIIPPFSQAASHLSVSSAVEYAVIVLQVQNIIICGHSDCGGCRALALKGGDLNSIPLTKNWVELSISAREKVEDQKGEINYQRDYKRIEQENIVLQLNNLLTYPFIKEKYQNKSLQIYGWYYDIGNGIIYNYNRSDRTFIKIEG